MTLRDIIEQRKRDRRERQRRIQSARASRVAAGIAQQEGQTLEATVSPQINPAPQQQFDVTQASTREANLPFGISPQVGAQEGAADQRGRPEFGSFFGSGVLENLTSAALPALENVQKGIETTGGVATSLADFAPGQLFAGQNQGRGFAEILKEVSEESGRGGTFDVTGQAQNLAEAFRRTKMPSAKLDIIPGEGIKVGGGYLNEIDVGVKGAIELLPDAILAVGTGGVSLSGTGVRGALKGAGTVAARTVGADIVASGVKQTGRAVKGASNIRKVAEPVRKSITNINFGNGVGRIDRMSIDEVKNAINRLPAAMQGSMSAVMSTISPVALLEHSNKLARFTYGRLNSMSLIPGAVEVNLAVLADKVGGIENLPVVAGESLGADIGRQTRASFIGRAVGRFRDTVRGRDPSAAGKPVFEIDDAGNIINSGLPELDGKAWVDVAQSFFEGDFNTIRNDKNFGLRGSKNYIAIDVNGKPIRSADSDQQFSHFVTRVNVGDPARGSWFNRSETAVDSYVNGLENKVKVYVDVPQSVYDNAVEAVAKRQGSGGAKATQLFDRTTGEPSSIVQQAILPKSWSKRKRPVTDTLPEVEDGFVRVYRGADVAELSQTGADFVRNQGTEVATFFRHYLETIEDMSRHYEMAAGKAIQKTAKMRFQDGFYAPQVPNGGNMFNETRTYSSLQSRQIGDKPRSLKKRSLFSDTLQEAIDSGDYKLAGPMETMQSFMTSMYSGAIDQGFGKAMRRLAKQKGSGVINFNTRHKRAKASVATLKAGKNLRVSTINRMEEEGFGAVAEQLRKIRATDDAAEKKRLFGQVEGIFEKDIREIQGQYYQIPTDVGRIPPAFTGLMFDNKDVAKRVADANDVGFKDEKGITAYFAKTGDLLRVAKTGFDFGFHMIHGLPALGFAFGRFAAGHPIEGLKMTKAWGESVKQMGDSFFRPEVMARRMIEDAPMIQEAVENGLQISRAAQDTFLAIQNNTILSSLPKRGAQLDKLVSEFARSFERAFVAPGDLLRVETYKALRNTAAQSENGLQELAGFANKMTGALSSSSFGVARSQQQLERGFLFFSPRYTRSAMALLSDFYRGGLRGELARESIVGMLWLGTATYLGFAKAMNQEPILDPSDSRFMTLEIGDDRVGVGGFWTQFARVTSRLASTAWDEDAREAFGGEDFQRNNQLLKWVRSRSAPAAGVVWDIAMGEDFMGREISGVKDWAQHAGRQSLPIWAEAGLIEDPYRTGALGIATEVGGARVRPLSASERRRDLREDLAEAAYGLKWEDLNTLQRKRIEEGSAPNVSGDEVIILDDLSQLVREQRAEVGREEDVAVEKWYSRRDEIEEEWLQNVGAGTDHLSSGAIDLEKFRTLYLQNSNSVRRSKMQELNDPEGDYQLAVQYFQNAAEKFGIDHPEDVAYSEYIEEIIATDAFDDPEGFDFRRRDEAVQAFRLKWGDEVYAYVQEVFATGRNIPPIVGEFWKGRSKFEYYWSGVEQATLASMPRAGEIRLEYQQWLEATDNEREKLENESRLLKRYLNRMSDVKKELRKKDQLLDAWLFRWGYTSTLSNSSNVLAPDGLSDPREYWRQTLPFPDEQFGIGTGVQLTNEVGNLQPSV